MIQFGAWSYFWFTASALTLAWWAWFTVRTYRNLPGQAWRRQHAAARSCKRYVTFTSTGIHVDIERYLRTDAGKAALDRIDRS